MNFSWDNEDSLRMALLQGDGEAFHWAAEEMKKILWLKYPLWIHIEDADSQILIGILSGCRSHDPQRGVKLKTLMYSCVKNQLLGVYRKSTWKKRGPGMQRVPIDVVSYKLEHNGDQGKYFLYSQILWRVMKKSRTMEDKHLQVLSGLLRGDRIKDIAHDMRQSPTFVIQTRAKIREFFGRNGLVEEVIHGI